MITHTKELHYVKKGGGQEQRSRIFTSVVQVAKRQLYRKEHLGTELKYNFSISSHTMCKWFKDTVHKMAHSGKKGNFLKHTTPLVIYRI